jgi:peroxiredoxin Q/BCP
MSELKVGDLAPDFSLPADTGESVRLSDFRGKRVILYFYPADNTGGCTMQACSFRDMYPVIEEQNGIVLGVSSDGVESHRKFKTKYNLPFLLLADEEMKVANLYGLQKAKLWGIPLPLKERSQFVIDEEGRIASIERNVNPATSASKAVNVIA